MLVYLLSLILLVAAYDRTHSRPADKKAFLIYNYKYKYTRLAHNNGGFTFYDGNVYTDQIWTLSYDYSKGGYFIYNAKYGDRLACMSNGNLIAYDGSYHDDQKWNFQEVNGHEGWYYISNYDREGRRIALWGTTDGGTYSGDKHDDQWWRLEDIYASVAMWKKVASLNNQFSTEAQMTFQYTTGYSQSITQSSAWSVSVSQSLSLSGSIAIDGMGLEESYQLEVTETYESSVTNAMSSEFTTSLTFMYVVPPNECLEIRQILITQNDYVSGTMAMESYCGDWVAIACNTAMELTSFNYTKIFRPSDFNSTTSLKGKPPKANRLLNLVLKKEQLA